LSNRIAYEENHVATMMYYFWFSFGYTFFFL